MPPLRGIDRGLDGDALRALEWSGHGRRLAIVDRSYNIPRWAEVVSYQGATSADALVGIVKLVPVEENRITFMSPGPGSEEGAYRAQLDFEEAANRLEDELEKKFETDGVPQLGQDSESDRGFYTIVNDPEVDTLFVRTRDERVYACATFIVGHSQE